MVKSLLYFFCPLNKWLVPFLSFWEYDTSIFWGVTVGIFHPWDGEPSERPVPWNRMQLRSWARRPGFGCWDHLGLPWKIDSVGIPRFFWIVNEFRSSFKINFPDMNEFVTSFTRQLFKASVGRSFFYYCRSNAFFSRIYRWVDVGYCQFLFWLFNLNVS